MLVPAIRTCGLPSPRGLATAARSAYSLFLLDACGFHRVAPQRRPASDERGKLGRRVAERIDADLVQPLDRARFARRLCHLLRDAVDDRARRRGGREKPVPGIVAKAREELRERREGPEMGGGVL